MLRITPDEDDDPASCFLPSQCRWRHSIIGFMKAALLAMLLATAAAQERTDPYATGATLGSSAGCPVFVLGLLPGSPAERAGLQRGDVVTAVNGTTITGMAQAVNLLRSDNAAPVSLTVLRGDSAVEVVSQRERRSSLDMTWPGKKMISGALVPPDTTQAEVDRMLSFDEKRSTGRVIFPNRHYPASPDVFYPGFEMFVLRDPAQLMVTGIEEGPGSRAGVHWGDVVISVNGVPVAGKDPDELEPLFSSLKPVTISLRVDRLGVIKTFELLLAKAEDVAKQNHQRFAAGRPVPIWVTDQYLQCFLFPNG
jgi:S1-C subfamily serine protease